MRGEQQHEKCEKVRRITIQRGEESNNMRRGK
jgi:hypothetical protein